MIYISPAFAVTTFALIGLCIGSFLNVVIYRLPKMLEAQFETEDAIKNEGSFSLSHPPSHCTQCRHPIGWHENIPLLSYLLLRGRCSACRVNIGLRYPLIELCVALIFSYCAWRWHFTWTAAAYAGFSAALLALGAIDWDTTYLPDDITVPLTWAGLVAAGLSWLPSVSLQQSLTGICAGYLSLWLIYWAFKLFTGREGMGYGDFKLYAAIGAWMGWQALIPTVLVAASLGATIGLVLKWRQRERQINGVGGYIPFGPFLAIGAVLELVTGWQL